MTRALTQKQEIFCQGVAGGDSYVGAYRAAYNPTGAYNMSGDIYQLRNHPGISTRIAELTKAAQERIIFKRADLVRWHLERMAYDPAELIRTEQGACEYCHGDGHLKQWRLPDYMEAVARAEGRKDPLPDIAGGFGYNATVAPHPDCPRCDGKGLARTVIIPANELRGFARTAYEGVKETRHGIEVKMADKLASSQEVAKLLGYYIERAPVDINEDAPEEIDVETLDLEQAVRAYKGLIGTTSKVS